jgi:predicted DNA-binding WGR domain protein
MRRKDRLPDFQIRLEKINHVKRQSRFYHLGIARTLFGEWYLMREWGRIGAAGGQSKRAYFGSREDCEAELQKIELTKVRRGYATIPIQLELFCKGD